MFVLRVVFRFVAEVDVLHLAVDLADGLGAQAQARGIGLREVALGLVAQLVLQTGPHVHRDGAQLDLHRQVERPLRDDDRHLDNQMQAPVARGLRLFDVVRLADDVVRLRPGQQAAQIVDIVQIVADDADSGHIGGSFSICEIA